MRLNQFLAAATGISRRGADDAIGAGQVSVNGKLAVLGQQIDPGIDQVQLSGQLVKIAPYHTIVFNKPTGYVTSRAGQGSQTIYDLLPTEMSALKPAGRLDKDSSGLLILTNDGHLSNRLVHPSHHQVKRYQIELDRPLDDGDAGRLADGVGLAEGISQIKLIAESGSDLTIELTTGWNRQIRRTFEALKYDVESLERLSIGKVQIGKLATGQWRELTDQEATWLASL